jgi:hypothetical protein
MRSSASWALQLWKAINFATTEKVKTIRLSVSVQRGCGTVGLWRAVSEVCVL